MSFALSYAVFTLVKREEPITKMTRLTICWALRRRSFDDGEPDEYYGYSSATSSDWLPVAALYDGIIVAEFDRVYFYLASGVHRVQEPWRLRNSTVRASSAASF